MIECDAETLQLLLNLYQCYCDCKMMPSKRPTWKNFDVVNKEFCESLVNSMFVCKANSDKKNILKDIFRTNSVSFVWRYKKYTWWSFKYNLQIDDLEAEINAQKNSSKDLNTEISAAFDNAMTQLKGREYGKDNRKTTNLNF